MTKLSFTHDITERRDFGQTVINQRMEVVVDYDPKERSIDDTAVYVSQGDIKIEISKLLNKAEGNPLVTIIEAIDWEELYADQQYEKEQSRFENTAEEGSIMADMDDLRSLLDNHKQLSK
jgi:hypothetical protein